VPIYDFHCSKCNKDVERMVKISDSDNVLCDVCGTKMEKIVASKMTFQLTFNDKQSVSWGSEGYQKSQRNREKDANVNKKHF
jgi:putative FmdB family regulatory protein